MASNQIQNVFQCSGCQEELNLESKTLSCLHSFCRSCLERHLEGDENDQCPECLEPLTLDQLSLSPFLVKSLKRRQLETTDWKCDLCLGDGIESPATNWCHDCQKVFCSNCSRCHKTFQKEFNRKHNMIYLEGMEKGEAIKVMTTDVCYLHQKEKDCYCERCNMCYCDTCYQNHSADSPGCSSSPVSVREEALKQKSQGPTLAKEMDDLEMSLRRLNEKMRQKTEELNSDCDSKCQQFWMDYEEMRENAKRKTNELCEDMRQMTTEQLERWRELLEENDKILKQLEIWRLNLHHLLNDPQQDMDVVCSLRSLGSKLSSRLHKSVEPEEKCQLGVTVSDWWLQVMEDQKSKKIGSVSLMVNDLPASAQNLTLDKQWNLHGSDLIISAICVSKKDSHIFLSDYNNQSIIEYTEWGEFVCECQLFDGANKFTPYDMCLISADIFGVACGGQNKLIFLKRKKNPPFLKIKKVLHTEERFYYSLCGINETVFTCDNENCFKIDSFTKEGKKMKTIKTREPGSVNYPRIRADPSTGDFWGTVIDSSEVFCYNSNGDKLRSVKTKETISDFYVNEFGHLYFCNENGIFSLSPKKILCKYEKKPEGVRTNFVLKNKMFVCHEIDGKYLIKIYKIFH